MRAPSRQHNPSTSKEMIDQHRDRVDIIGRDDGETLQHVPERQVGWVELQRVQIDVTRSVWISHG